MLEVDKDYQESIKYKLPGPFSKQKQYLQKMGSLVGEYGFLELEFGCFLKGC